MFGVLPPLRLIPHANHSSLVSRYFALMVLPKTRCSCQCTSSSLIHPPCTSRIIVDLYFRSLRARVAFLLFLRQQLNPGSPSNPPAAKHASDSYAIPNVTRQRHRASSIALLRSTHPKASVWTRPKKDRDGLKEASLESHRQVHQANIVNQIPLVPLRLLHRRV